MHLAKKAGLASRMREAEGSAVREILKLTGQPAMLSMAGGLPAGDLFDLEGIGAAVEAVLGGSHSRSALQYSVTEGDRELRECLAGLSLARGVAASTDNVLVTTGSQQALDLAVTTLLDPGDVVLTERPCYLAALQLFALAGVSAIAVETDDEGLDPSAVRAAIRTHRAKAIYTVPNFQNPTGRTMTAERRSELARVAAEEGTWILEDDPYGELRYRGRPIDAIAASSPEQVVYISSLSKVMAPGLRLGWIVAPASLRSALVVAKQARDLHTSTLDQRIAAAYLISRALPEHLRRLRSAYAERLDSLLAGLPEALPAGSAWTRPDGGMFAWVTFPEGIDTGELLHSALREGVAFVPGAPFYADRPVRETARISFVTLPPPRIAEGLRRLRRAWS